MKNFILIGLSIIALIFAIGTVGAFDHNHIGFGQFIIQSAIAVVVEWLSLKNLDT